MLHGRLRFFLGFGAHHIKEALSLGPLLFLCWRVLSALLTFVLRRLRGATLFKAMVSFMSVFPNASICFVRGFAFISLFDGFGLSLLLLQGDVVSVISGEH
jgi:hypothetical protein